MGGRRTIVATARPVLQTDDLEARASAIVGGWVHAFQKVFGVHGHVGSTSGDISFGFFIKSGQENMKVI